MSDNKNITAKNNIGNKIMANNKTQHNKHKNTKKHNKTDTSTITPVVKKVDPRFVNEKPGDREIRTKKTANGTTVIRVAIDSLLDTGKGKFFAVVANQTLTSKKIAFDMSAILCILTDEELKILFSAYKKIVLKEAKAKFFNVNNSVLNTFSDKNMLNIFKSYDSLKDLEESFTTT